MPFRPIQINTSTTPQSSGFKPIGDVRSIINQETAKQDFASRVQGDIQQRGANVANEINNPNQNPILGGLKATAQGFGAIGDIAGEAFKSIAPDLSKKVGDLASKGFGAVTDKLASTDLIKGAAQGDTSQVEGLLQGLQASGDISNNILLAKGTADVGNKVVDLSKQALNSGMGSVGTLPEQLPAEHPTSIYQKQALKDWNKPIESNTPGFKKSQAIFENATSRGTDIPKTLVDNKVFLGQNIQDGKYLTSDSADMLRTNAGEASKTYLRPALEIADYSTPPTPVVDVVKNAIKSITNDKFIPIESKNTLIERITKLQPELETQYPSGMTLVNQLDEKILRDIGSKYSPVGDIATNLEASKNKAIADALRKSLVANAPEGVPVDAFQKELSKMYQSADYLDSLNGKKVPQGLGQRLMQTAAKVTGAVTGESLGGGILGGVGGYHLGGILENYFANMSNPFKAQFLEQLQKVNPEAFSKIKEYIGVKELQSIMTPKLGPGTPLGTEKNPIITPAPKTPTTYEAQAPIIGQRLNNGSVKKPIINITTKVPKNPIEVKSTTITPKVKGTIPENSLISEAKKYKSADINKSSTIDSMKKQPRIKEYKDVSNFIHDNTDSNGNIIKKGDTITVQTMYGDKKGTIVDIVPSETNLPGDVHVKLLDGFDVAPAFSKTGRFEKGSILKTSSDYINQNKFNSMEETTKNRQLSKSQLTDIWNKANKK